MKILICTGIFPPQVGGPAYYGKGLQDEFLRQGHEVVVLTYGLERTLPTFIRHKLFFWRTLFHLRGVDMILALDTFSVGFPAVCAAWLFRKKIIVRVGGDFLWETYIARTGDEIPLRDFYNHLAQKLNWKERAIFLATKFTLHNASTVVFSTQWQKDIFERWYSLDIGRTCVIENEYGAARTQSEATSKTFLWAGRMISLKNIPRLKRAFAKAQLKDPTIKLSLVTDVPKAELVEKIKSCYATILPSLSDVSPNFILDGLRAGKPAIVTQENGITDRIKKAALFVDPLDERDIEQKILLMADDAEYAALKKAAAAFSFVHSMEHIAHEYIGIYKRLVA